MWHCAMLYCITLLLHSKNTSDLGVLCYIVVLTSTLHTTICACTIHVHIYIERDSIVVDYILQYRIMKHIRLLKTVIQYYIMACRVIS